MGGTCSAQDLSLSKSKNSDQSERIKVIPMSYFEFNNLVLIGVKYLKEWNKLFDRYKREYKDKLISEKFTLKPTHTNFLLQGGLRIGFPVFVYRVMETYGYMSFKRAHYPLDFYLKVINLNDNCFVYFDKNEFMNELKHKKLVGKRLD